MGFLFDANLSPRVARALAAMDYPVVHIYDVPELPDKAKDPEIISWCRENGQIWVTQDIKSRRMDQHGPLIRQAGVSVAWFRPPSKKGWSHKRCLEVFLKWIDDMLARFSADSMVLHQYSTKANKPIKLP